eukprot:203002_1
MITFRRFQLLYSVCMLLTCLRCQSDHTISTILGSITGTSHELSYSTFLGIPYSESSPTGDNRFRPSTKKTSSYPNTLDATTAGPPCLQPGKPDSSEDCLTLNIWTPDTSGSLPVMVWIHGGGFTTGSSSDNAYAGHNFATQGIVFVSINYRLGLLGFLALPEIAIETGNTNGGLMGNYDQIVALQWINSYISDFGGDASQITIFGESAGGLSVCTLLFSPIAAGLFNKAIIQSGTCSGPWGAMPEAFAESYYVPTVLNAYGMASDDLSALRARDASDFKNVPPLPSVDGYILPNDDIFDLSNTTTLNANKIMIGTNSIDSIFAWDFYLDVGPNGNIAVEDGTPTTSAELRQYLTAYFNHLNNDEMDVMVTDITTQHYAVSDFQALDLFNEYQITWLMMSADSCLVCPSFELIEWIVSNPSYFSGVSSTDLYLYRFVGPTAPYYAKHFAEVPFVFGLDYVKYFKDSWHMDWNQTLADNMHNVWLNFAKDLEDIHLVSYGDTAQNAMVFGGANGIETVSGEYDGYRNGWCPFLATQYSFQKSLCYQDVAVDVTTTVAPSASPSSLAPTSATGDAMTTLLAPTETTAATTSETTGSAVTTLSSTDPLETHPSSTGEKSSGQRIQLLFLAYFVLCILI